MLSDLPFDDLFELFDLRTFERGEDYYRRGRVGPVQLTETKSGWQVEATVGGSGGRFYEVDLLLKPGATSFYGSCSCPVGRACKHMAATLMAVEDYASAGAAEDEEPWEPDEPEELPSRSTPATHELFQARQWLGELDALHRQQDGNAAECLVYVLAPGRLLPEVMTLSVFKTRRLKKGGFSSTAPYRNFHGVGLGLERPAFVVDSDEAVLRLLRQQSSTQSELILHGEWGGDLVAAAVATGRCYWQNLDGEALVWDRDWAGEFGWQQGDDGGLRLGLNALPPGWAVLAAQPTLAIDTLAGCVHPVRTPLPAKVAEALLRAPALQVDTWSEVAPSLTPLLARWQLALPDTVKPPRLLDDIVPVPCLQLSVLRYGPGNRKTLLRATPSFRYGPERVAPDVHGGVIRAQLEGERVLIPRQPQQERAQLLGLRPLEPLRRFMGWQLLPEETEHDYGLPDEAAWRSFVAHDVLALQADGWQISLSPDWPWQPRDVDDAPWYGELAERPDQGGWFGLSLGVEVDGQPVNLVPLLVQAVARLNLADTRALAGDQAPPYLTLLHGNQLLRVPTERLRPLLAVLADTFGRVAPDRAVDGKGRLRLSQLEAARLAATTAVDWRSGRDLRALGQQLEDFTGLASVTVPDGFQASLRGYQQTGLNWLQFLREHRFGGALADDMGLGKTVQTLAHLWVEKCAGRLTQPALIVCPKSLLPNWRAEAARFAPGLRLLCIQGNNRAPLLNTVADYDVVVTTYPLLARDGKVLARQSFALLICDEAQQLKNPKTQAAQAARLIEAGQKLALTGTPMENHLGELWALFDLLQPGYLGDADSFRRRVRHPVEKDGDSDVARNLARRVKPFLLRRTKEEVATELPPKTEIVRPVVLSGGQRDLYETVRATMDSKLRAVIARKGLARSSIDILEALLKLRQVCCDPRLLPGELKASVGSAKLELLFELLPELIEEGRRVLLFSQFTSMLGLIEAELKARDIAYVKLTGQTRDRETPVKRFQAGEVPVFLISLKAGGVGLNLTAADTVIHYDPWWNPAVENQATDRAYRIGQDKPVFVYKLIAEGTVEERILALQARKAELAAGVYGAEAELGGALSSEDLQALFQPLAG